MSWFGLGGSKKPEPSPVLEHSFDNSQSGGLSSNNSSFGGSGDFGGGGSSFGGGLGGLGDGMGDLQGSMAAMQQQVMAQQLILKLTDMAFDKCIKDPSGSLSSSQKSCVIGSVSKYIDGTAVVISTMTGQK